MNENIDLTKILKDCPIGWKFYSSVYGDVEFAEIYRKPVLCNQSPRKDVWLGLVIHNCEHPIRFWLTNGFEHSVSSRGEMIKGCGECTLFPSKDQRDWSKFTAPWYKKDKSVEPKFKVGDRIRHKETNKDDVYEIRKVYDDSYGIAGFTWMILMKYQDQYELVSNKFDPKTLKPFDKVLARIDGCDVYCWFADFVSIPTIEKCDLLPCIMSNRDANMVIPYNDETKHLVGTTDEAPEYYRYWED